MVYCKRINILHFIAKGVKMKNKNIIRVIPIVVLLCSMLMTLCMADENDVDQNDVDVKIIRFDTHNNLVLTSTHYLNDNTKACRIDIPMQTAYDTVSNLTEFKLSTTERNPKRDGENSIFKLEDYPYVKIRMRTNFPGKILFYGVSADNPDFYAVLSESRITSSIYDGHWYDFTFAFKEGDDPYSFNCNGNYSAESVDVTAPSLKFCDLRETPDGDLFAEIAYIAYFKNLGDMLKFGDEPEGSKSVVTVSADFLANLTEDKINTRFCVNEGLKDDELYIGEYVRFKHDEIAGAEGAGRAIHLEFKEVFENEEAKDLYDYPYVKIKFRANKAYDDKFDSSVTEIIGLKFLRPSKENTYGLAYLRKNGDGSLNNQWYTAMFSFNRNDFSKYKNGKLNTTSGFSNADGKWITSGSELESFPEKAGEFTFTGLQIDFQGISTPEDYIDIAYIKFYKTKWDMLADSMDDDEKKLESMTQDFNNEQTVNFALPLTTGKYTLENELRDYFENKYPGTTAIFESNQLEEVINMGEPTQINFHLAYGKAEGHFFATVNVMNQGSFNLETLGAQIRPLTNGETKADLRFGAKLMNDYTNLYRNVSFGMLLIPKNCREEGYALEKATLKGTPGTGAKAATYEEGDKEYTNYRAIDCPAENTYEYDGYTIFTAVITDIPTDGDESAYDTEIVAIPYITFTSGGEEYTYYGDEIVRSVNQVKAAVEAEKADTTVTDTAKWDTDDDNDNGLID